MKIQAKIFIILLLVTLYSGGVTIIISQRISKNIIKNNVNNQLEIAAESRAHHIETVLNGYKQSTKMLATGNAYKDAVNGSIDYTFRIEQVKRRIKSVIQSNEVISRIRIIDRNGIVIASSHDDVGFDKSGKDIFLKGRKGLYTGDLHYSEFTRNLVISMAAPISVNGKFSGVIVINFDVKNKLFKITTCSTSFGKTGEIYIINREGYMITPSRFAADAVLKQKVDTHESREWMELTEEEEKIEREEINVFKSYTGKMVIGTHYRLKAMDWCLLAEKSEEEAFASVARLTNIMLFILAAFLVPANMIGAFLSGIWFLKNF